MNRHDTGFANSLFVIAAVVILGGMEQSVESAPEDFQTTGFFPIGMYCVESPDDLPELANGGFNLIQDYRFEGVDTATDEEATAYLDAAQRLGMRILMGIQQEAVLDHRLEIIEKRIRALKDHPALFGWQLFDEPENAGALATIYGKNVTVSPETFQQTYQLIKSIDPIHPVISVAATTLDESYEYLSGVDTMMLQYGAPPPGIYDYPWDSLEHLMPLLKSDAQFLASQGKSFILNTAAYNIANDPMVWPTGKPKSMSRYPTKEEIRLVAYYSLIHGGQGVIINCYRFPASEGFSAEDISSTSPIPEGRKQWQVVSSIASELQDVSPIFLAPNSEKSVIIDPENSGIEFLAKEYQDTLYLVAANPSAEKKTATFILPVNTVKVQVRSEPMVKGGQVYSESRSINIDWGYTDSYPERVISASFTDSFDGYGVHVYEIQSSNRKPSAAFFPLILYGVGPPLREGYEVTQEFPEIANAGFTVVHNYQFEGAYVEEAYPNTNEAAREFLDAAHRNGLKVLMGVELYLANTAEYPLARDLAHIRERVSALKDHPALWAWQLYDEPEGSGVRPEELKLAYQTVKNIDQHHPAMIASDRPVTEDYAFADGFDNYMPSYFPIPPEVMLPHDDPADYPLERMAQVFDAATRYLPNTKTIIGIIQVYNMANDPVTRYEEMRPHRAQYGRYPTKEEIRFMSYLAILHGAKGLSFCCYRWDGGGQYGPPEAEDVSPHANPTQWSRIKEVVTELKAISPILLAPTRSLAETGIRISGNSIETMVREHEGKIYLFTANPTSAKVKASIHLSPEKFPRPEVRPSFGLEVVNPLSGHDTSSWQWDNTGAVPLSLEWEPYGVAIYEIL